MSEAKNVETSPATRGSVVKRFVMRLRLLGTYSIEGVGEYYAVRKHGLFYDKYVNLDVPHLTMSINGEPYFNQALGNKTNAERILKRFNGAKAYSA